MITLPSVNHTPVDYSKEIKTARKALKERFAEEAGLNSKQITEILNRVENLEYNKADLKMIAKRFFPGKRNENTRSRVEGTMQQLQNDVKMQMLKSR